MSRLSKTKWFVTVFVIVIVVGFAWMVDQNIIRFSKPEKIVPRVSDSVPAESSPGDEYREQGLSNGESFTDNSLKDASAGAPESLPLTLIGVVEAGDQQGGIAIIQNRDNEEQPFSQGSDVFGLAILEEIYSDRVILSRDGHRIELVLSGGTGNIDVTDSDTGNERTNEDFIDQSHMGLRERAASAAAKLRDEENPDTRPARLVTDKKFKYVSSQREEMERAREQSLEEMSDDAWYHMQYEPELVNDEVTGLRLTDDNSAEFLAEYGLGPGDIISSVNGQKVDSPESAAAAMAQISELKSLELTVERGSQSEVIKISK